MDGIFQVTVAAERCDYTALIRIFIFNQCRKVLFQQHKQQQSDYLLLMTLIGTTGGTELLLAAALNKEAPILAGRYQTILLSAGGN